LEEASLFKNHLATNCDTLIQGHQTFKSLAEKLRSEATLVHIGYRLLLLLDKAG